MAYESAKTITEQGLESLGRYYSVYRAMVVNNTDPDHMNRSEERRVGKECRSRWSPYH